MKVNTTDLQPNIAIDTTQIDQPDTPAPVFAARAFKSALFGTPARPSDEPEIRSRPDRPSTKTDRGSRTPPRPPGILLTPGTGTSRRKRVSFGHDVKKTNDPLAANGRDGNKRTRLNNTLEEGRPKEAKPSNQTTASKPQKDTSSDEWEEETDDEDHCYHDITVDLNEPHSQSGKYWKEEFEKYHEDAKVEIGKLLKYKQLAKSYAKHKDAEAADLAQQLKEEQRKVIEMEKKIAAGASEIASKRGREFDEESPELLATLTKQTALAVQYRTRVQDLEAQLEEVMRERDEELDTKNRRRPLTSPRTQRTLLETQRELRRARKQVKELGDLKDQVKALKAQLRTAEQRATKLESEKKPEGDVSQESSRARDLRAQLREAREDSRKKDDELRQLKKEFEDFKKESQIREEDTKGVLERAHNKISDLKKEIRTLKAADSENAARTNGINSESDAVKAADKSRKATVKPVETRTYSQHEFARRNTNLIDVEEEDTTALNLPVINPSSYHPNTLDNAIAKATQSKFDQGKSMHNLRDRPNLEKPRWQPFVPRSPRNRDYLSDDMARRIENGGITPAMNRPKEIIVPDLPALAKSIARANKAGSENVKVDLIEDHYARLGGPDVNNSTFLGNTSRSTLPPERRAAAIARIERRMAEKKRAQRQKGFDKENVRP